ncbi:MAG TPA: regulatory protein RecX [Firmicutes bacterium]|nr:regulatory protein RecX [Bacillota bacterium]
MDYALRALARRPLTQSELRRKLLHRGYEATEIGECLARLSEMGYLDDRQFAKDFVDASVCLRPSGRRRLLAELRVKGVPDSIAQREVEVALPYEREKNLAMEAAKKRLGTLAKAEPRDLARRLYQFLLRRGFGSELAKDVVKELIGLEE